ncbi:MAG: O-antigen ligase family protein, partial [Candidatus Methylomirabilales bacterium]
MVRRYSREELLRALDWAIEVLVYLYVIFMFTKFGAAFRSIGMYGAFGLWLARWVLTRKIDIPRNPVAYLFFAFIGSATLSGVLSSDVGESVRVFKKDVFNPLLWFLVIATHFGPSERQKRLLTALGTSGIIVILCGYWNYFRGETYDGALAAFRDPNSYAMNVAILLPFVFALAFVTTGWQGRVLWGTVAMLGVIASVLTLSRGGWLGLATILAIWGAYMYQARSRKQLVVVSACMVLLLAPVTLTNSDVIRKA